MNKIKYYRKHAGLTQFEFAQKMKVAQSAVSQWESGKRIPNLDTICKIADALGVAPMVFLPHTNEPSASEPQNEKTFVKPEQEILETAFIVPLVTSPRCRYNDCGQRVYDVIKEIEFPISYKHKYGEDIVLIKAVGESMMPTIRPRDLLICKPGAVWEDGNVVIANVDDGDMIKRIFSAKDGGIDLIPDNSDFRELHFMKDQLQNYPPKVLGRIVRNLGQDL